MEDVTRFVDGGVNDHGDRAAGDPRNLVV